MPEGPAVLDDGRRCGEGLILRVELVGHHECGARSTSVHRLRRKAVQIKWLIGFCESGWLGFLDTYRTLCVAPNQEIRSIFEELRGFSSSSVLSSKVYPDESASPAFAAELQGSSHRS